MFEWIPDPRGYPTPPRPRCAARRLRRRLCGRSMSGRSARRMNEKDCSRHSERGELLRERGEERRGAACFLMYRAPQLIDCVSRSCSIVKEIEGIM